MRKPLTLGRAIDRLRKLKDTRQQRYSDAMTKARNAFDAKEKKDWDAVIEQLSDDDCDGIKKLLGETQEPSVPGWANELRPDTKPPQVIDRG